MPCTRDRVLHLTPWYSIRAHPSQQQGSRAICRSRRKQVSGDLTVQTVDRPGLKGSCIHLWDTGTSRARVLSLRRYPDIFHDYIRERPACSKMNCLIRTSAGPRELVPSLVSRNDSACRSHPLLRIHSPVKNKSLHRFGLSLLIEQVYLHVIHPALFSIVQIVAHCLPVSTCDYLIHICNENGNDTA